MTLGAMWVRHYGNASSELLAISDSRLSGSGRQWDYGQKVFPISRGDCIMSFSGDTDYAYPLLLHAIGCADGWDESRNRRFKLESLRGHMSRVLSSVLDGLDFSQLHGSLPDDRAVLLLGGYSWWSQRWIIWSLRWDNSRQEFTHSTLRTRQEGQRGAIMWTGDRGAVGDAKRRLNLLMRSRGKSAQQDGLNMEPLEVLRDVIRAEEFPSVGGAPQVGKVYRHLDSRIFVVPWQRDGDLRRTFGGRFLLDDEHTGNDAQIDPDNPDVFLPFEGAERD